jgi:acyl carrier protein
MPSSLPTEEEIKTVISHHLGILPEKIQAHSSLKALGANPMDLLELAITIEKEFQVSVEDDVISQIDTPSEIFTYLQKQFKKQKK